MRESRAETDRIRARVLDALRGVMDPELGLVYGLTVDGGRVHVTLTTTTPACPLAEQIVRDAERVVGGVEGVDAARVEPVWSPPWTPDRTSPSAQAALGWDR